MRAATWLTCFVFSALSAAQAAPVVTTLYSFGPSPDGANPNALTVLNGVLYGTTGYGGSGEAGTVFSLDPVTGAESVLHSFTGPDGRVPSAPLLAVNNKLYGTTVRGGTARNVGGTLFSFDPATATETVLYSFDKVGKAGSFPSSDLLYKSGELTSVAARGGQFSVGTIFGYNIQSGRTVVRYSFAGGSDGAAPFAVLRYRRTLYGVTGLGGSDYLGTVFAFDPISQSERVLHSFTGSQGDGKYPSGSLLLFRGKIYGLTDLGGVTGNGTIFRLRTHCVGHGASDSA